MVAKAESLIRTLAVFLLLCGHAWGLEVTPQNPVPPYSLIRAKLDAGERSWVLKQDFSPVDVEYTKSGFVFTGPPGRYVVLAMTADGQSQAIVEIGGSGPTPVPPIPPTPPTPVPDRYGLVKIAYDAKLKLLPEGRPFIPAVAANFSAVASACAAGGITDRKVAIKTVQDANRATLGTSIQSWHAWGLDVGRAIDMHTNAGAFPTAKEYGQVLSEVAAGLMMGVQQ